MMNLEQEKYACEYPQKDEPCQLPAFDWIELSELSPPLRVRVCAAHWLGYNFSHLTFYKLPPEPNPKAPPAPAPDLCGQSIRKSTENTSRPAAASELLLDFAEWLAWQDGCRKRIRGW